MKLRLIQLTGLFAFVVVILMLTPPDKGFGGAPLSHLPSKWINTSGYLSTPDNPGIHLIGKAEDPRGKSFYEICGTNGDESVSGFAWYYRGGKVSDSSGHDDEHDPKYKNDPNVDTNSDRHLTTYQQNIYVVQLSGSASTSAKKASGSLNPSISNPSVIKLSTAHQQEDFDGQGKITLDIPALYYHVPRYDWHNRYLGCDTEFSETYYFKPTPESDLKAVVHIEEVTETRTGSIDVAGEFKGASSSFTYTWEWKKLFRKRKGRGFGMKASVGGWWAAHLNEELKLQGKTAEVYGNVEEARLPIINAEFDTINSWCPPDNGYSRTQRKYIPHVSAEHATRVK